MDEGSHSQDEEHRRQVAEGLRSPVPQSARDAWQRYYHEAPVDFDPVAEEIFEAGWKAALAQSDAGPQENRLHRARRFVQAVQSDLQSNLTGDQHILMLDSVIDDIQAALAQPDAEPEWNCATQGCKNADTIEGLTGCAAKYRAKIKELEAALAQSDAESVAWPDMGAAVKAGLAWRNPAPNAAPSAYSNTKTVTIDHTIPPRPDASAIQTANSEWARFFYDWAQELRARAADRSGK